MGGKTGKATSPKTMLARHDGSEYALKITLAQAIILNDAATDPVLLEGPQIKHAENLQAIGLGRTIRINGRGPTYFERGPSISLNDAARLGVLQAARERAAAETSRLRQAEAARPVPGWPGNTGTREAATRTLIAAALRAAYDGVSSSDPITEPNCVALRRAVSDFYTAWGDERLPWEMS